MAGDSGLDVRSGGRRGLACWRRSLCWHCGAHRLGNAAAGCDVRFRHTIAIAGFKRSIGLSRQTVDAGKAKDREPVAGDVLPSSFGSDTCMGPIALPAETRHTLTKLLVRLAGRTSSP